MTMSILGLDDFRPSSSSALNLKHPLYTSGGGNHLSCSGRFRDTPQPQAAFYDAGYDGLGQRIVVAGQSAIDLSDIQTFRRNVGLSNNDPQFILAPGSSDPGRNSFESEGDLDVEWAGAVARNASIVYVYLNSVSWVRWPMPSIKISPR